MSCLTYDPQIHARSRTIGPPMSKPYSLICLLWSAVSGVIGACPVGPTTVSSSGTFDDSRLSFVK